MKTLEDGYSIIECSNCGAPLCEVFVYNLEGKPKWQGSVRADCAHCGDKSYKFTVEGHLAFSSTGFTRALPEPDERDASVIIVKTEILNKWT